MCNTVHSGEEGYSATFADRFVFYNVDDNEHLKEETNFNETLPRESSCFISRDDLD